MKCQETQIQEAFELCFTKKILLKHVRSCPTSVNRVIQWLPSTHPSLCFIHARYSWASGSLLAVPSACDDLPFNTTVVPWYLRRTGSRPRWYQNLRMLNLLYKMAQYLHIIYDHPPTYTSLGHLQYLIQCKRNVYSCKYNVNAT